MTGQAGEAELTRDGGYAHGQVPELADIAHLIGSTTVDGVVVLFAHRDGPATAGLIARVGWSDEPLARSGITHLVEHLALHGQDVTDLHHNGTTSDTWTHFHATGTAPELVAFLNGVCAALRSLPVERLEVEKDIVKTESSGRSSGFADRQRLERYGARGPGLSVYDSFGLTAISANDVLEWAGTHFTRDNVVVWITTQTVPDGLDLRLPEGMRRTSPAWAELPPVRPSYFVGQSGGVLIDAVVERSHAAVLFARVASKALFRALRQEGGYSYTARCDYEPIDADRARISIFADALADKQAAVVGGVVDVLAALRAGNFTEDDLDSAKAFLRQGTEVPSLGAAMLVSTAINLLEGVEIVDPLVAVEERDAVTVAEVVEIAEQAWRGALAQVPEGALDWAGFTVVPACSTSEVSGTVHTRLGADDGDLVIGEEGVSLRLASGPVTVRFDDCEALEWWPDGARRLTGADGFRIHVEPSLYEGLGPAVIGSIDAAVPVRAHVPRRARDPEAIPQRPVPAASPQRSRGSIWLGFATIVLMLAGMLAVGFTVNGAMHLNTPFPDGTVASVDSVLGGAIVSAVVVAATVALIVMVRVLARRSQSWR